MVTARCWHSSHKGGESLLGDAQVKRISPDSRTAELNLPKPRARQPRIKTLWRQKSRVLILGGGFAGLYAALEFERWKHFDIAVTLRKPRQLLSFYAMLHEIAASDLDITKHC